MAQSYRAELLGDRKMPKIYGWEIFLGILGFIAIAQIVVPFVNSVQTTNGGLSGFIMLGIIIYLMVKEWRV